MDEQRLLLVAGWGLSALAAAAITRAKGLEPWKGALAGLFGALLGIIAASVWKPAERVVDGPDGTRRLVRPGRLDWLIGGQHGAPAAVPAVLLSIVATGVVGFSLYRTFAGDFNELNVPVVQQAIEDDLSKRGLTNVSVTCPQQMSGAPDSVTMCDFTASEASGMARVHVENAAGDVTWTYVQ